MNEGKHVGVIPEAAQSTNNPHTKGWVQQQQLAIDLRLETRRSGGAFDSCLLQHAYYLQRLCPGFAKHLHFRILHQSVQCHYKLTDFNCVWEIRKHLMFRFLVFEMPSFLTPRCGVRITFAFQLSNYNKCG